MALNDLSRRRFLQSSLLASGALTLPGCELVFGPGGPFKPKRIFLITLDTIRRDHFSFHGYPRETTPFLTSLFEKSVVFQEALCACSNTLPSHASLLSGLHVEQHGARNNNLSALHPDLYMLAEYLGDGGYKTGAFTSVIWMQALQQGFDIHDSYTKPYDLGDGEFRYYRQADETIDSSIEWLKGLEADASLFNWIHLYDPHDPYHPPEDLHQAMINDYEERSNLLYNHWTIFQKKSLQCELFDGDKDAMIAAHNAHDAEILFADQQIERLYREAEKLGLLEESLWIVTTDHGEGHGTHNYNGHGKSVYPEQISCPFMLHTPGGEFPGRYIPERVHHVDLVPTLAALLDKPFPESHFTYHGHNLMPMILDPEFKPEPRLLYCQRRLKDPDGYSSAWEDGPVIALWGDPYGCIFHANGRHQLFNTYRDPYQSRNLMESNLEERESLPEQAMILHTQFAREGRVLNPKMDDPVINAPFMEELEALGYLGDSSG